MPASFNGISLGFIFSMPVAPNPNGRSINAYCGANGLEVINMGSRGGHTVLEGAIVAAGASALTAAENSFRAAVADGGAYQLIDSTGTAWFPVIMVSFQPKGRVYVVAGGIIPGLFLARKYDAEFLHLI